MTSLPAQWAIYAQYQRLVSRRSTLDDRTWGLERALNVILDREFSPDVPDDESFHRAAESGARKHRDHVAKFLAQGNENFDPPDEIDLVAQVSARQGLDAIAELIGSSEDRTLVSRIAQGYDYAFVARLLGRRESVLRSRMLRLRGKIGFLKSA